MTALKDTTATAAQGHTIASTCDQLLRVPPRLAEDVTSSEWVERPSCGACTGVRI